MLQIAVNSIGNWICFKMILVTYYNSREHLFYRNKLFLIDVWRDSICIEIHAMNL